MTIRMDGLTTRQRIIKAGISLYLEKGFANSLHGTSGVGDYMPGGGSGVWPE